MCRLSVLSNFESSIEIEKLGVKVRKYFKPRIEPIIRIDIFHIKSINEMNSAFNIISI
jgi:hypothetical protein